MSRTLNLVEHLLVQGRKYQDLGLKQEATQVLNRLAKLKEIPADIAEETQFRLGELQLQRCRFAKARRHLSAALAHQPRNAQYHFQMAEALDADAKGSPEEALDHYRQAVELHPDNANYLCDYGPLALELGQRQEGLTAIRRALELAPNDTGVVRKVAQGLCQAELLDEARTTLRAAMFRNPRDGRFRQLWNDFQFQVAQEEQEAAGRRVALAPEDGPILLPFRRSATKKIRRDGPSTSAPHRRNSARLPKRKNPTNRD